MALVQKSTESGETTQLFIQFVMMQQQQALHALGRHPSDAATTEPRNLKLAKVFIDQLGMIRRKTAGNLNPSEQQLIAKALGDLEAAYLDVAGTDQRAGQ